MCPRTLAEKKSRTVERYSDYISVASFGYILLALSDSILFHACLLACLHAFFSCHSSFFLFLSFIQNVIFDFSGIIFHIHIHLELVGIFARKPILQRESHSMILHRSSITLHYIRRHRVTNHIRMNHSKWRKNVVDGWCWGYCCGISVYMYTRVIWGDDEIWYNGNKMRTVRACLLFFLLSLYICWNWFHTFWIVFNFAFQKDVKHAIAECYFKASMKLVDFDAYRRILFGYFLSLDYYYYYSILNFGTNKYSNFCLLAL